jgi:hypothetical protein
MTQYTDDQVETLLRLYRKLFPKDTELWGEVARYLDFERPPKRKWSCVATDFHSVSLKQFHDLDTALQARRPASGASPEQNGAALADLAQKHGCGYSIGINRWTDSALHDTLRDDTQELIVLIGHDRHPIVEKDGKIKGDRGPLNKYPLLDSTDPRRGAGYGRGLPSAEQFRRARTGLLYLNLVPDYRPPGAKAAGNFPFDDEAAFGYSHCVKGLQAALKLALSTFPRLLHVVTWSRHVWKALREFTEDWAVRPLRVTAAAMRGGTDGFPWLLDGHRLRIHPFPHTVPSYQRPVWTNELWEAYSKMWNGFLKASEVGKVVVERDEDEKAPAATVGEVPPVQR